MRDSTTHGERHEDAVYCVGVDGGGSRCRVALGKARGPVIATAEGGAANIQTHGEIALAVIDNALDRVLAGAGLDPRHARKQVVLAAGLAGAEWADTQRLFKDHAWGCRSVTILHDAEIAHFGAFAGEDGALVIVGTGISGIVRLRGKVRNFSGWAFPYDDRASGAWLGKRLMHIALREAQGIRPLSAVFFAVRHHLGASEEALAQFCRSAGAREFAQLAPLVASLARQGIASAEAIVREGVAEIEDLLGAMKVGRDLPLVVVGGLREFYVQRLSASFRSCIRAECGSPLDGALAIARRHANA